MFGIGVTEILLILIVALVIVGPEKLPELARTIAKGFNEFKRTSNDIKRTIDWDGEATPSAKKSEEGETEAKAEAKVAEEPLEKVVKPKKKTAKTAKTAAKKTIKKRTARGEGSKKEGEGGS